MSSMEQWIRNQRDIYSYKAKSFRLVSMKFFFKSQSEERDNLKNYLIEKNANVRCVSSKDMRNKNYDVDKNGNLERDDNENQLWRRLSLQSYKKRKQQRREEKTKPVIAAVLRTYDKRTIPNENSGEWL